MFGDGAQALYRLVAQPRAQAFPQLFPAEILLWALVEQFAVLRRERRQLAGLQAHGMHGGGQLQLFETAAGQFEEHGRLAFGAEQADRDLAVGAPVMFQVQGEALHAAVASGEKGGEIGAQPSQGEEQGLVRFHVEIEFDAQVEGVRRPVVLQRQWAAAAEAVDVQQQFGWEATGQGGARQLEDLAQMAQSHASEGDGQLPRESQAVQRKGGQLALQRCLVLDGQAVVAVRQDPRRHRVRRQAQAMAEAQRREFLAQAGLEAWPGAEQGKAGLHFQQQRTRIVQADLRAETVGPGGEEGLPALHGGEVVFRRGEVPAQGLGGDQRLTGLQAERACRRVDRLQLPALRWAAEQRQRCVGIAPLTQRAVHGQLRQENASPEHGRLIARRWPAGRSPARGRPGT